MDKRDEKILMFREQKKTLTAAIVIATIAFGSISTSSYASSPTTKLSIKSAIKTGTIDTSAEQDFLNRTNALRASVGVGPLKVNSELLTKARNWSQTQANSGTIFHSTLTDGVSQNWQSLGENVGMGPDVLAIHNALVASPRHYQNLVDPRFTEVGMGVVNQNGTIYVSQVFMQFMPTQAAAPAPAPAPTTPPTTAPPAVKKVTKAVAAAQAAPSNSTPVPPTPVAESAPFKTASQELTDVIAKLHQLEN